MRLFSKLFWSFLTVFLFFALIFYVSTYRNVNRNYLDSSSHYLQEFENFISPEVTKFVLAEDFGGLDEYCKSLQAGIRVSYIDLSGKVLADSDEELIKLGNHRNRPEILSAAESGTGFSWRFSSSVNRKMLYYAHLVEINGERKGYLRLSFYDFQIEQLQNSLLHDITKVVITGVILLLIITFLITRNFIKPIQELAAATRKLANGDFSIRLKPKSNDELYDLSNSFNSMTEQVQNLIETTRSQKEALHNIIDNINELLWVIDAGSEKITLANKAFVKFLNLENIAGKYYWQVIRHLEINEIIKKVLEEKLSLSEEVSFMEHDFFLSVNYLQDTKTMIFLLHDITPLRQLEKVKRDFVTNASHELRTPLASIKGYTELLKDTILPENMNILNIVERNTARLTYLVNDILSLASLEKLGNLDIEKTNVSQLLDNSCLLFEPKLIEKQLEIIKEYDDKVYAELDSFRFEQLVNNLIDNAIKYTQSGTITLRLKSENHKLVFECEDTGIGIPDEAQTRLFERFFVVDKSRSRKSGGTGLGLSIVKHIVQLHAGNITVESKTGAGSCFRVEIPQQL